MSEIANETERRKRRSRVPATSVGKHLVVGELLRRGFEARLANVSSGGHDVLVCSSDMPPQRIRVRTVHSAPWYVRRASFVGSRADQVTVYVLLGPEMRNARFFVAKNRDLAAQLRQPPSWNTFGFIDAKSVEKYENNWDILK